MRDGKELLRDKEAGVPTHPVRTGHINSTSNHMLKNYLSLTKKKRQHRGHDETISHKTCFFSHSLIH